MLEYFVHLDKDDPPSDLVLAVAEVPEDVTRESVNVSELPANWRDGAAPPELTRFGDEFVAAGKSCVLFVPSVLAPHENNCLLNPAHPEFGRDRCSGFGAADLRCAHVREAHSPRTEEILSRV